MTRKKANTQIRAGLERGSGVDNDEYVCYRQCGVKPVLELAIVYIKHTASLKALDYRWGLGGLNLPLWNDLNINIKNADSIDVFKERLMKELKCDIYNW